MNKKILTISIAFLSVIMLVLPVMAEDADRGPQNAADKNPNAEFTTIFVVGEATDLVLPSGVTNRWINWPDSTSRVVVKPADKFNCPTTIDMGDAWFPILTNPKYWNKWVLLSKAGYEALFLAHGAPPPPDVPEEGVYMMYNSL